MPKKTVEAHPILHHGKTRYRVIVPVELNEGKRRVRLFTTKTDAAQFAADLNRQRSGSSGELLGAPANVQESCVRAIRLLGPLAHRMYEAAESFLRELEKRPRQQATVATVTDQCLESKEAAGRRPSYLSQLRVTLGQFSRRFGDRHIATLSPAEIESWLNGNGWSQATRRGYLTDVRTLYTYAVSHGYCVENFAQRVERPSHDDKPPGILTVAQGRTLLNALLKHDRGLIPYVALGMFAGIRPYEARQITAADVANGYVHVSGKAAKTRQRRLVTLLPVLKAWLGVKGGEYQPKNLKRRFERIVAQSGLTWTHDVLRHSFASYHLALTGSAEQTALQLGHSNTAMLFAHYRELVTKTDAEAWFNLTPPTPTRSSAAGDPRTRRNAASPSPATHPKRAPVA